MGLEGGDEKFLVIVERSRFLEIWKRSPNSVDREVASQDINGWKLDRKFKDAEDGFARGKSNPVPIITVSCGEIRSFTGSVCDDESLFDNLKDREEPLLKNICRYIGFMLWPRVPYVSIPNGVTRTIWLLANGAEKFPVLCEDITEAIILHKAAGIGHIKNVMHCLTERDE